MDMMLKGKRALVTASSGNIGRGTAIALAAEGVRVAVNGRSAEKVAKVVAEIEAAGGEAVAAVSDLATEAGVAGAYEAAERALGGIDILVNNFGGATDGAANRQWFEVPSPDWYNTYHLNVVSGIELVRRAFPGMKAAGWGRIINISTVAALSPRATLPDYSAANAAQNAMTKSLSKAVAQSGVTVNAISPGLILTDISTAWLKSVAQQRGWEGDFEDIQRRAAKELHPICTNAFGQPEDIGAAVVFLASPRANYITGANLVVDGGARESV
jgi:3-oxoacyl-[acyl-carrier protein] reductase